MSRKNILIILGAAIVLALGLAAYLAFSGSPATARYTIDPTDRIIGNRNAKVVLIEYPSYTCPHCADFNNNHLPAIKRDYVDTGKVLYVFRPVMRNTVDGAVEKLARCQPADRYFAFTDMMFREQARWHPQAVPDTHGALVAMGRRAGMSAEQVDRCIASTKEEESINKVGADGQARYGIEYVPTFIINGAKVEVPQFTVLPGLLDKALAEAK